MATLVTVGVALLALLVVPGLASPASASSVALSGASSQQWAYGAQKWANVSLNFGNATYTAHAFFGWQVVFTATNTSATTVMLEAERTMAGSFYADLCSPSCTNPAAQGNLSIVGWEKDAGFANLTTTGTVYENGTPFPAVGLLNASAQADGNISERLTASLATPAFNGSASTSLFVAGAAHSQVSFPHSLGLVPYNLSPGLAWNSTSAFSASGGWSIDVVYAHTGFAGTTTNASFSPSGTVQGNGDVALHGYDAGTIVLDNGRTVPVITLVWTGPFDNVDGIILVPHDFNMFGSGEHAWAADSLGSQAVSTANLDLTVDDSHHLQIVAAASSFDSSDTSLATAATPIAGPAPAAPSGASASVVQAQPESVASAQQSSNCLVGQCSGPAAKAGFGGLGLALLVGLVVLVVVGTVGVIEYRVWARRRAARGRVGPLPAVTSWPPPGASMGPPPNGQLPPPTEPPRTP
ncbi:MAG TPA: hypothetical protein VIZ68_04725 [Thermoplasmata archaeon]